MVNLLKNKSYKVLLSASSDAQEINLNAGDAIIKLNLNKSTSLWEGEFNFKEIGDYSLKIYARDEIGNSQTKEIVKLKIINNGHIFNGQNNERLKNAQITLYVFDSQTNGWLVWDGKAFGQTNPQETDEDGQYGFSVPAGKYRLEIKKDGFKDIKSKELEIAKDGLININIPLMPQKGMIEKIMGYFK